MLRTSKGTGGDGSAEYCYDNGMVRENMISLSLSGMLGIGELDCERGRWFVEVRTTASAW